MRARGRVGLRAVGVDALFLPAKQEEVLGAVYGVEEPNEPDRLHGELAASVGSVERAHETGREEHKLA